MRRVTGNKGVLPLECVNPKSNKWRIRWDIQDSKDGDTSEYMEEDFPYLPTIEEIKQTIIAWYNSQIDEQIRSGFTWKGMPIWLSTENQNNYKAAFDAAVMSDGEMLPVTFKFGTDDEPVYHEFATIEELGEFYYNALGYVQTVLSDGWKRKDSVDFSFYETNYIV